MREWRNTLAVQMGTAVVWPASFFCLVFTNTGNKREDGRVLTKGGYKLPVIDACCRGGRQLKTCGAHR